MTVTVVVSPGRAKKLGEEKNMARDWYRVQIVAVDE
jgi:hypothetical protein